MRSVNQITVCGYLGSDATWYSPEGESRGCVKFRMALNRGYRNRDGEWVDRDPLWITVVQWMPARPEWLGRYVKGKYAHVWGELLPPRMYTTKDGEQRCELQVEASFSQCCAVVKEEQPAPRPAPAQTSSNELAEMKRQLAQLAAMLNGRSAAPTSVPSQEEDPETGDTPVETDNDSIPF